MFTNLKYPFGDRKNRKAREVTVETDIRLGATVWFQSPVAHVVVLIDGVRAFIPLDDYKQSRKTKIYKGKKMTIIPPEKEEKKKKEKRERRRSHW